MLTVEDHDEPNGSCYLCSGPAIVKVEDVNLCLTHYVAQHGAMDTNTALQFLVKCCRIQAAINYQRSLIPIAT